jgi:hypothetical protein
MSRFTILETNPTSVLDRTEGQTFMMTCVKDAQRLLELLQQQERLIEELEEDKD